MKRKELPEGITKKQSHYAQKLYSHPEVLDEVIENAYIWTWYESPSFFIKARYENNSIVPTLYKE